MGYLWLGEIWGRRRDGHTRAEYVRHEVFQMNAEYHLVNNNDELLGEMATNG